MAKKEPDEKPVASSWTVRQKLDELLEEEFSLFKDTCGCGVGDNYEAATAILAAIRYLREYNVNGPQE